MRIFRCLPFALLAAMPVTAALAGPVEALSLTYAVHVGGVHVLDADAEMALGPDGYRAGLKMQTDGFLGRVAQWKTDIRAQGLLSGPLPRPRQFTAHGSWRDQPRLTTVDYTPDGTPTLTLADPEPEKDREPVPANLRLGTVDPVSAIVAVLDQVARKGDCDITVPVYDGRQRYDLVFATQGETLLEASDLSVYAGPATACSVKFKPVAGRWKESRPRDRDREGAKRKDVPVTLYIAATVAGGPPVPVRLEMDSPLGAVKVHLAAVNS
ncbi:MAG: DUF3108 domain-containing protein [Niveispirillum sp.]|uniref:DUF3108 domain-containing protein n=1 Tax=Niveispirillum sp. TaxID=1917217 RepID=UPI003BA436A4